MPIRVRDDDVLLIGRGFDTDTALPRFKEVHRLIVDGGGLHVAAILCGTIHEFPGAVEFIREQYQEGTLIPEIHGWEHVDYAEMDWDEIIENLKRCIGVIRTEFNYDPNFFYTPWGGCSDLIWDAAEAVGLTAVSTANILYPKRKVFGGKGWAAYREDVLEGRELLIHWWQDRWFDPEMSKTHSIVKTLQVIRENSPRAFRE